MGLHCRETIARVRLDRAARLPAQTLKMPSGSGNGGIPGKPRAERGKDQREHDDRGLGLREPQAGEEGQAGEVQTEKEVMA
jgi:hypothetical protein